MNFACVSADTDLDLKDDEEEEICYKPKDVEEKKEIKDEKTQTPVTVKEEEDTIYESVEKLEPEVEAVVVEDPEVIEEKEPEREVTPDPLQRIAAQLHGQLQGYRADFDQFSNLMEEHRPAETQSECESPAKEVGSRKLSREEEISLVKSMSKQDAWSHVMSQVYEVN